MHFKWYQIRMIYVLLSGTYQHENLKKNLVSLQCTLKVKSFVFVKKRKLLKYRGSGTT